MNNILYKSCENFAKSLGFEIVRCEDEDIKGYVAEVDIKGDLNYKVYVVLPKEKLDLVSNEFFGDTNYDIEDLTKEIANLIVGNAVNVAYEKNINFEISVPKFLGEYKKLEYDDKLCIKTNGVKFFILYKES